MPDEDAPFEVEFHLGGGVEVSFRLPPNALRQHRDPAIAASANTGGRGGLLKAGVTMVERAVTKNLDEPIRLVVDDSLWLIPTRGVMAARFRDPTMKGDERSAMGFSADRLGATPDNA